MWYFQVRYDSRVVNYDRKLFIRLTTVQLFHNRLHVVSPSKPKLAILLKLAMPSRFIYFLEKATSGVAIVNKF